MDRATLAIATILRAAHTQKEAVNTTDSTDDEGTQWREYEGGQRYKGRNHVATWWAGYPWRLVARMVNGRCIPYLATKQIGPYDSLERTWSLVDCYLIGKAVSDADLKTCENIEAKMEKVFSQKISNLAAAYGEKTGLAAVGLAAMIKNNCKKESMTAFLLKDPEVVKMLNQKIWPLYSDKEVQAEVKSAAPAKKNKPSK